MPKGGARSNSGPPPDPNALRRDRKSDGEWLVLSADGRVGQAPKYPLPGPTVRELTVWGDLWVLPQAIEWERLALEHMVGIYVRRLVEAEEPEAPISLGTLVRQLADDLFLTRASLARNRIRIEQLDPPRVQAARKKTSSKTRLRVVAADAVDTNGPDAAG